MTQAEYRSAQSRSGPATSRSRQPAQPDPPATALSEPTEPTELAEVTEPESGPIELTGGQRPPFTMLPDWVALSGISPGAQALYWQLSLHINHARGDRTVFPSRDSLARRLGFRQTRSVDRYLAELVKVGAVTKYTARVADGLRARNRYVLHQQPPRRYRGPWALADLAADDSVDAASNDQGDIAGAGQAGASAHTPVVQHSALRVCSALHCNQIKENQTKENPPSPYPPPTGSRPRASANHPAPDQKGGREGSKPNNCFAGCSSSRR